ncbi:MAG: glycosyltransferase 87 family protein [Candidatus Limnocylindrales bacterium]
MLIRPFRDRRFRRLVWVVVGVTGWAGLIALGATLLAGRPPQAGFDLTLVLDAGRRVAAGLSPYAPGAVSAGTRAEDLFYSYPPPIAQLTSLVAGLPIGVALALSGLGASLGLGLVGGSLVGGSLGRRGRDARPLDLILPTLALAPFVYPFAIALLFGNLDAWFPFAYGAVLVAVARTDGARGQSDGDRGRWGIVAGVALGLATLAKLYPGALLGWLAIRGVRAWIGSRYATRRGLPAEWAVLGVAVVTIAVVAGVSVAVGGIGPWEDYVGVLRGGVTAQLAGALNIGPASQLALLDGAPSLAAHLAPVVGGAALLVIALAAWFLRRVSLSLAIAAIASLVVSPITWFHYPVAILPFAVAAWAGASSAVGLSSAVGARGSGAGLGIVAGLLMAALVVAGASIAAPVAVWIAVALVLVALAISGDFEPDR